MALPKCCFTSHLWRISSSATKFIWRSLACNLPKSSLTYPKWTLRSRTTSSGHAKRNYLSAKWGEPRSRNIRTARRILATGAQRKRIYFPSPVFSLLPPQEEPRPTLRVHARHALRLGRSISANGDYIFQPGTHPTSDVNIARRYTPRRYFPYSLLIALARISRSRLRAGHTNYDSYGACLREAAASLSRRHHLFLPRPSGSHWFSRRHDTYSPTFANSPGKQETSRGTLFNITSMKNPFAAKEHNRLCECNVYKRKIRGNKMSVSGMSVINRAHRQDADVNPANFMACVLITGYNYRGAPRRSS